MKRKATPQANFAPLWQTSPDGYTPQSAAQEFARTYWDRPRKVIWKEDSTFQVEDGVRTYSVVFRPGTEAMPTLYQIGVDAQ